MRVLSVIAQSADTIRQVRIIGGDGATFAGSHGLPRMKAEAPEAAPGSCRTSSRACAKSTCGVLDHGYSMMGSELRYRPHVCHASEDMNRDDGPHRRPLSQNLPYIVADLVWGVEQAFARRPEDLLSRRTRLSWESPAEAAAARGLCEEVLAGRFRA